MERKYGIKDLSIYLKKHSKNFIIMSVFMLLNTIVALYVPILWGTVIEKISAGKEFEEVIRYLMYSVIVSMSVIVLFYGEIKFFYKYLYGARRTLRYSLCEKVLNLEVKAFDEVRNGEFINRVENEVGKIVNVLDDITSAVVSLIKIAIVLMFVSTLNIYIGIVVALNVIANFNNFKYAGRKMKKCREKIRLKDDDIKSNLEQLLTGIREIKSLGIKKRNYDIAVNDYEGYLDAELESNNAWVTEFMIMSFIENLTMFGGTFLGIYFVYTGELDFKYLVAIQAYFAMLNNAVWKIGNLTEKIKDMEVAIDRIMYLLKNEKYKDEEFGEVDLIEIKGNVILKDIEFGYNANENVLKDISLEIEPNKITALVGKSGSGKSTLFSLLLRFYDYRNGKITIDGIDIKDLTEKSLRHNISVIRQEPFLFNVSIKENLLMVKEDATDEEIENVCKKAHIHHYINELKDGYKTIVGEGGVNLSGGQKQRLAIARALLKGSKILLFDEATSALDNKAQEIIKNTINELKENHTIVVIAHRLSTIVDADNIIMIDNGQVVAEGKHEELMDKNDIYKELYSLNN
ncbi:MAG: ABC transporter ATP-binding protein/permease [Clostridia bacterium]|jgi:ATP-binding cassette subfamily B protein|nr:ABC transporter ATP-binding protein/permease [Clostridia bacterium]